MVTFYRRMPKFDYVKAGSMEEALGFLEAHETGKVRVYAGGTDMIPKLKARVVPAPELLVDLKGVPGMDTITADDTYGLRIGALASIYSVAHSTLVKEKFPILAQAAGSIASVQVQNRGTLAGNICNAVPSADSAPALLCLGAKVVSKSPRGEREIDIQEFFAGPNKTVLAPDELVTEIRVPDQPEDTRGIYIKLSPRSRMDLAVVGVAVMVRKADAADPDIRIGLGAVAPRPMRAFKAEETLKGVRIGNDAILTASKTASEESAPIDDHRASAEYRRMMVEVLVNRALRQTLAV